MNTNQQPNSPTIEQIMQMSEDDRLALIFRLAMYSENKMLASDIERIVGSERIETALDNSPTPKAW